MKAYAYRLSCANYLLNTVVRPRSVVTQPSKNPTLNRSTGEARLHPQGLRAAVSASLVTFDAKQRMAPGTSIYARHYTPAPTNRSIDHTKREKSIRGGGPPLKSSEWYNQRRRNRCDELRLTYIYTDTTVESNSYNSPRFLLCTPASPSRRGEDTMR